MGGLKIKNIFTTIKLVYMSECDWLTRVLITLLYMFGCFKVRCIALNDGRRWLYLTSRAWNPFILFVDCDVNLEIPSNIIIDIDSNDKVFIREIKK
jgi:hypothetical protein